MDVTDKSVNIHHYVLTIKKYNYFLNRFIILSQLHTNQAI